MSGLFANSAFTDFERSQAQNGDTTTVVRGDADSTIGSRTTITLSSGKWAVVKPSSGAVTASLAKKRLVLFQLPSDVSSALGQIGAPTRPNLSILQMDLASFEGAKLKLPAQGGSSGTLDAGSKGKFTVSAPLSDESANMRLAVTPDKRSDYPSGARLLAPTFGAHVVISSAQHEACAANLSKVPAVPVATAIGSLDPVAVPQLGRLPSIAQATHMKGYFTPAGSSADPAPAAASASSADSGAAPASAAPSSAAKTDKKDKKARKEKKKKRKSTGGAE